MSSKTNFALIILINLCGSFGADASPATKDVPMSNSGPSHLSLNAALDRASAHGFMGTWIEAALVDGNWQLSARSKSVTPPMFYVVDGLSGKILYENTNSDGEHVPEVYRKRAAVESYSVQGQRGNWTTTKNLPR